MRLKLVPSWPDEPGYVDIQFFSEYCANQALQQNVVSVF